MNEHTPVPWAVGYGDGLTGPTTPTMQPFCGGEKWPYLPISVGRETIALVPEQVISPLDRHKANQMDANAAFIVRAVNAHDDLLADMEELTAYALLTALTNLVPNTLEVRMLIDRCQATIAKAKAEP